MILLFGQEVAQPVGGQSQSHHLPQGQSDCSRGPLEAGELQKDSKRKLEVLEEAVTVGLPLPWEQGAFSRVED